MVVISDTTAISNLLKLGKLYYIQSVFKAVIVPQEVFTELLQLSESGYGLEEFTKADWISVLPVEKNTLYEELSSKLDEGETAAIVLAKEKLADFLIMDEKKGRIEAEKLGIKTIGILGILIQCRRMGICSSLQFEIDELKEKAGFWISDTLYK